MSSGDAANGHGKAPMSNLSEKQIRTELDAISKTIDTILARIDAEDPAKDPTSSANTDETPATPGTGEAPPDSPSGERAGDRAPDNTPR